MDNSVISSWFSELEMENTFLNDECVMMDFLDDGEDLFQTCFSQEGNTPSPTLIPKSSSSSTTSLSVLSAMGAPPLPTDQIPAKQLRPNNNINYNINPSSSLFSPTVLTFGKPVLPETNPQQATVLGNLSADHQDDVLSEVLNLGTKKSGQKPKKSGGRVRPQSQTYDHIIAERKRREHLSQRFVALSAIVPGLKKMDKTSVLGDAINYLKHLQERVKTLEEQAAKNTKESVVLVKRSRVMLEDEGSSDEMIAGAGNGPDHDEILLPEIEAKLCNKNILLRVHCEKQKGVLLKILSEIEKLNLAVISTSVSPFGSLALDVTIIALMETKCSLTVQELIRSLRLALRQVAQAY